MLIIGFMLFMYPWSCTPQSVPIGDGGEGCDTIFVESPVLNEQINAFQAEIARLKEENGDLTTQNNGVKQQLQECNETVAAQEATITTQTATIAAQTTTISQKNDEIAQKDGQIDNQAMQIASQSEEIATLEAKVTELENRPPETVIDTVYQEADYITVGGVEYKVDEIELIKPRQEIVEWEMFFCFDTTSTGQQTTGKRPWIHEGDPNVYPHFVNVASRDRGMIKVWFEQPLDSTIKIAKSWILEERRNYDLAKTQYVYKGKTEFENIE